MYNSLYHLFSTNPELINNGVLLIDFNCNTTKPCSHKIQFIDKNNNISNSLMFLSICLKIFFKSLKFIID